MRDDGETTMRTTLTIADDVLALARHRADADGRTLGEVISDAARMALSPPASERRYRNGILLTPITAKFIADLVWHQQADKLLSAFSWQRFDVPSAL